MSERSPLVARLAGRRVHYGWIVAAVAFVTLITSAGFRSTAAC